MYNKLKFVLFGVLLLSVFVFSRGMAPSAFAASTGGAQAAKLPSSEIGPAYYLYSIKLSGPCLPHPPEPDGSINFSHVRYYRTDSGGQFTEGSVEQDHYWQRGFSSAYKYTGCGPRGGIIESFYGKQKMTRKEIRYSLCWGTGCNYVFTKHPDKWYKDDSWL